ncbi:hypothetical protein BJY04DRAFT_199099 [Aspergillus karnatakaensis]|uniref:uncharacterized protein n=1 Tax=Aspergillus karnatakaensis TaxID=1810916 RepID=UPI003CCCC0BA
MQGYMHGYLVFDMADELLPVETAVGLRSLSHLTSCQCACYSATDACAANDQNCRNIASAHSQHWQP